jgi:hypothetical protein
MQQFSSFIRQRFATAHQDRLDATVEDNTQADAVPRTVPVCAAVSK